MKNLRLLAGSFLKKRAAPKAGLKNRLDSLSNKFGKNDVNVKFDVIQNLNVFANVSRVLFQV
jgi:hypothetical protein